uniref:PPM-type phosphatase domain-containing protein n=1 Tax=Chrysotila carterae TaxID=13221 RepID=A0A6T0CHI4_CHRCT
MVQESMEVMTLDDEGSSCDAVTHLQSAMEINYESGFDFRVKKGEDAHNLRREVVGGEPVVLAMVADGHGGSAASAFCRDFIFDAFLERANGDASAESLQAAGRAAFYRAHAEVHAIPGCTAGCTLTLCAVNEQRGELTCCNVGDTLAYLVSSELAGTAQMVSADHRIDHSEEERARLKALGGNLSKAVSPDGQPGGPLRVYPGGLAVARGIGDADCADFVSCEPHVETRTLPDDFVLVVATDGLWDGTTLKQVTRIALKARTPEATAEKLLKLSVKLCGLFDDMTCIIVQRRVATSPPPLPSRKSRFSLESRLSSSPSPTRKSRLSFEGRMSRVCWADEEDDPSSCDEESFVSSSSIPTSSNPANLVVSSVIQSETHVSLNAIPTQCRVSGCDDLQSSVCAAERAQGRVRSKSFGCRLSSWTKSIWSHAPKRRSVEKPKREEGYALQPERNVRPGPYDDLTVKPKRHEAKPSDLIPSPPCPQPQGDKTTQPPLPELRT